MIDLDSLSSLVDAAPEPPAVERVERRGKQRRRRRRGAAIATTLAVLLAGVGTAAAIVSDPGTPHVAELPPMDHVRVTLLDGSHVELNGPESLGLTKIEPVFNAELDYFDDAPAGYNPSHSFSVSRTPPTEPGAIVGRRPTGDGHEFIVYKTEQGEEGVVRYPGWSLVVSWNDEPAEWGAFAASLHASVNADGFLTIAAPSGWALGSTDAPDVQLGDLAFFGPSTYPAGCPEPAESTTRTPQGWPVSLTNGAWWCDANAKVRVHVADASKVDAAIDGLRVAYRPL